jgi:hypothetical protein
MKEMKVRENGGCMKQAFSAPLLLLNLTGANWA